MAAISRLRGRCGAVRGVRNDEWLVEIEKCKMGLAPAFFNFQFSFVNIIDLSQPTPDLAVARSTPPIASHG